MEKTQKFIVAHVNADEKKVKKKKVEKKRKSNFLTDTVQDKKKR